MDNMLDMVDADFFSCSLSSSEKIYIVTGALSDTQRRQFAIDNAEAVLPLFESAFQDDRPRRCVEAAVLFNSGELKHASLVIFRDDCQRAARIAGTPNTAWHHAKMTAYHCCNSNAKTAALFTAATSAEACYCAIVESEKTNVSRIEVNATVQQLQLDILKGVLL